MLLKLQWFKSEEDTLWCLFLYTIYYPIHQFYYKHILPLQKDHQYHLHYTKARLKKSVFLAKVINSPVLPRMLCFLFLAFFFIPFSS